MAKNKENIQKPNLRDEIMNYDSYFDKTRITMIYIASVIGTILLGFLGFRLSLPYVLVVCAGCLYVTPKILWAISRNRYEEKKYADITSYIEQMLYSFRRNSKIRASLEDAVTVFPEGEMRSTILEAIDYIRNANTGENIYEEGLKIIEKKYSCRRIKSLHRFLVKVENAGGDHNMGVQALIIDRRLWMDRVEDFKREKSSILKEILISTVFASVVVAITMYMLPESAAAHENFIVRSYSTIYILANLLNIKAALTRLINYLKDTDEKEQEEKMLKKFIWFKNYNRKVEQRKGLVFALILIVLGLIAILLNQTFIGIVSIVIGLFTYFIQPQLRYRSTKKQVIKEIEKCYPDWLLELSLLLQTDNLHVALEKTLDDAPLIIREELQTLTDKIVMYPNAVEPYSEFLDYLPVPNIHSSMRLLYSISEYGSDDEERQIMELIERNSLLMNKAEEYKNNARLSRVFLLKFVPMGTSSLKLIVDMCVFMVLFISQTITTF